MKEIKLSAIVQSACAASFKEMVRWGGRCCLVLLAALALQACSDDEEDTPSWKETNANYFNELYSSARQRISSGDTQWKVIKSYVKDQSSQGIPSDYIVVHVIEEGSGTKVPLTTDTVRVDYQGRLIPTATNTEGEVFDQSWSGEYDLITNMPAKFAVNAVVDGFATALQKMHVGDRWMVYIPQELGYRGENNTSIPAYSTLVFDITLRAIYKPGTPVPAWK